MHEDPLLVFLKIFGRKVEGGGEEGEGGLYQGEQEPEQQERPRREKQRKRRRSEQPDKFGAEPWKHQGVRQLPRQPKPKLLAVGFLSARRRRRPGPPAPAAACHTASDPAGQGEGGCVGVGDGVPHGHEPARVYVALRVGGGVVGTARVAPRSPGDDRVWRGDGVFVPRKADDGAEGLLSEHGDGALGFVGGEVGQRLSAAVVVLLHHHVLELQVCKPLHHVHGASAAASRVADDVAVRHGDPPGAHVERAPVGRAVVHEVAVLQGQLRHFLPRLQPLHSPNLDHVHAPFLHQKRGVIPLLLLPLLKLLHLRPPTPRKTTGAAAAAAIAELERGRVGASPDAREPVVHALQT
mmetsp:Transcript_41685/g.84221  ORF Transcript_41685/g.84221 Transcript_41685/m.84221 type:complete len:352 (-) Transcript_41685:54-1109(-)